MVEALVAHTGKQIIDKLVFQPNAVDPPILKNYAPAQKFQRSHLSGKCLKYNFEKNEPKENLAPKELIICGLHGNDLNHMFTFSHLGLLNKYPNILEYVKDKEYAFENAETVSEINNESEFFIGNKTITIEVKKKEISEAKNDFANKTKIAEEKNKENKKDKK